MEDYISDEHITKRAYQMTCDLKSDDYKKPNGLESPHILKGKADTESHKPHKVIRKRKEATKDKRMIEVKPKMNFLPELMQSKAKSCNIACEMTTIFTIKSASFRLFFFFFSSSFCNTFSAEMIHATRCRRFKYISKPCQSPTTRKQVERFLAPDAT